MASFLTRCKFNPTAGGTTDWTVSSAVTGYMTPAAAGAVDGRTYRYVAESADLSQWEVGYGVAASSGTVIPRTTVLYNSSGTTSKINFSAAPQVTITVLADDLMPSGSGASLQATPADPTGTTSTSDKMMGLGGTCTLTPTQTGRLKVEFIGYLTSTGGYSSNAKVLYGTGAAPANGATVTGTQIGNRATVSGAGVSNLSTMISNGGIVTGLTPGTAYWFDLALNTTNAANTASIALVSFNGFEF